MKANKWFTFVVFGLLMQLSFTSTVMAAGKMSLLTAVQTGDRQQINEILARPDRAEYLAFNESAAFLGTPLTASIMKGTFEISSQLIQAGADVNQKSSIGYPLHVAARVNTLSVVRELVSQGAALDVLDAKGNTPLHIAAYYNSIDVTEFLLNQNADPNLQNETGWTPLMKAAYHGHKEIVELLLTSGVELDLTNNRGFNAWALAKADQDSSNKDSKEFIASMLEQRGCEMIDYQLLQKRWNQQRLLKKVIIGTAGVAAIIGIVYVKAQQQQANAEMLSNFEGILPY